MSQQTFSPGGMQVAEPPAPVLPVDDSGHVGDDNRRKLMVVGAAVGILVLALVGFFLMKGGSSTSNNGFVVPHHAPKAAAPAAAAPVVKLPKHVAAPVGRDPFKPLYTAPVAAAAGTSSSTSTTPGTTTSTTTSTPTTTTGGTATAPASTSTYRAVWIQLKSITASAATFDVGYSNGKTLKAVRYTGIKPLKTFASSFELLSIRNGVATLKFGDGSPFQVDRTHNTMVVG